MPRTSTIAQADIARTLRAFRGLGIEAEVRIYPDGMVIVCEKTPEATDPAVNNRHTGQTARTNALEEAARVADNLRCYGAAAISVADAAQKIRALKTNPPLNAGEKTHGH